MTNPVRCDECGRRKASVSNVYVNGRDADPAMLCNACKVEMEVEVPEGLCERCHELDAEIFIGKVNCCEDCARDISIARAQAAKNFQMEQRISERRGD